MHTYIYICILLYLHMYLHTRMYSSWVNVSSACNLINPFSVMPTITNHTHSHSPGHEKGHSTWYYLIYIQSLRLNAYLFNLWLLHFSMRALSNLWTTDMHTQFELKIFSICAPVSLVRSCHTQTHTCMHTHTDLYRNIFHLTFLFNESGVTKPPTNVTTALRL